MSGQTRQDALIGQLISALRKPWPPGHVLKIVGGLPTWAPESGGGASYAVKVQRASSAQTIPTNSGTFIEYDTVIYDSTGSDMWNIANPAELVAPVDGLYAFEAAWQLEDPLGGFLDTTTFIDAQVFYGLTTSVIQEDIGGKAMQGLTYARGLAGSVYLTATDVIKLDLYQESGINWQTSHHPGFNLQSVGRGPVFSMARVG